MTWAAENALLRSPLLDNWDFGTTPIAWPGLDFKANELMTGDKSAPGQWVDWDSDITTSDYLASGGGSERFLTGVIDCAILVEPVAGGDSIIRTLADTLESYYKDSSTASLIFRVHESTLSSPFKWEEKWLRSDWLCPYWRFEDVGAAGVTEEPVWSGQSGNQLTVAQTAHGLAVGDWIGFDGSDWVKAKAASGSEAARGIVSVVTNANKFILTTGDVAKLTAHGLTLGALWLSTATAGAAQFSEPALGSFRQVLGVAVGTDHIVVQIGERTAG